MVITPQNKTTYSRNIRAWDSRKSTPLSKNFSARYASSSRTAAQPSIAGVFDGAADSYEPARHRIKANLTPGVRLKAAATGIKTQKVQMPDPLPFIVEVSDVLSGTVNEHLTPGGVVQIKGGRLKLFTDNPDNGIFLIHESGRAGKLEVIVENKPSRLIAMLPADLLKGTYTVEVRTTFGASGRENKTMKTGRFNRELTVI